MHLWGNFPRIQNNKKNKKKDLHNIIIWYIIGLAFGDNVKNAPLAHLVEHLTLNQGVQGSIPWWRIQVPFRILNYLGWYFFCDEKDIKEIRYIIMCFLRISFSVIIKK